MCYIADILQATIDKAERDGDGEKARVMQTTLDIHRRDCSECAEAAEPVVSWKNQTWYEVREK